MTARRSIITPTIATLALLAATACSTPNPLTPTGATDRDSTPVAAVAQSAVSSTELLTSPAAPPSSPARPSTHLPDGASAHIDVLGPTLECGHGMAQPHMQYTVTDDGRTLYRFTFASTGSGVRIGYIVFHDDSASGENGRPCDPVVHRPTGGYVRLVSGAWVYDANQSNVETVIEYLHEQLECGRVQVDIAINRMLVVGQLRRTAKDCASPPPIVVPPVVVPPSTPPSKPPTYQPPTVPPTVPPDAPPPPPPPPPVDPPPPPPPPPPAVCSGPWTYTGTNPFSLPNAGDATELAYVRAHVSPLLVGPVKTEIAGEVTTWTSDGVYPVVIIKAGAFYMLHTNVTLGLVLTVPAVDGKVHAISHVSRFTCP